MVYVLLADGFEECEATAPIDILRRANADVITVAVKGKEHKDCMVCGSHNIKILADICEADIEIENEMMFDKLEMIVLPGGGMGVENLAKSETVKKLILKCADKKIKIGAICAAPSILANMGLLKGKTAIAYPSFQKYLIENNAKISEKSVITDGIFTTAQGAGVSIQFALQLVSQLYGNELSEKIKSELRCD